MAGSTCEAEYIATSEAANEGVWMKEFISDLGVIPSASGPMKIFCDNTSPIALAKESRFHKRTKHIKRRFNSIRDQVQVGDRYVSNISIIYEVFMLLYYPSWMFNGPYYALLYYFWD